MYQQHAEWRAHRNPRRHDREEAGPHHGVGQQEKLDERPPGLQVGSLRARVQRPNESSRRRRATRRIVVEKIMSKWSRLKNSILPRGPPGTWYPMLLNARPPASTFL